MRESRSRIEPIPESRLHNVCGGVDLPRIEDVPLLCSTCHGDNPGAGDMTQNPPSSPNRDELESDW